MSELFRPISTEQLAAWLFAELDIRDSILGIPQSQFFIPAVDDVLRTNTFGQPLETPFGPAAGPHTQMAQNIIASWLCGARYIELKTVQTLDALDVSKPCIDMEDEGYNVEWSQELKIYQAFDEYLRAWVLIHALHHRLGFPGDRPGIVFNLSVGYDLAGIQRPNVQWFLDQVRDCADYKQAIVDQVARYYPAVRDIEIPDCLSDNVTLSTMHGCPPDDVQRICSYLLRERRLHTLVKCNPTLLGAERVRNIVNEDLKYTDIVVPDSAFEHDLRFQDAVPMLENLKAVAISCDLEFGVKLSNTLEVENTRPVFSAAEKTSYLSGRPLHAVTVNLARSLSDAFDGDLPMSFSAGANSHNAADLLAAGMRTITACSDLLKTGGYLRLLDTVGSASASLLASGAASIEEFIVNSSMVNSHRANSADANKRRADVKSAAQANLRRLAEVCRTDPRYMKDYVDTSHTKTSRALEFFDCIKAPCADECPLNQRVPQYMRAVQQDDVDEACRVIRQDNPLPCILGRVCDHLCEQACVRSHLDEPLSIRDIKRFAMDRGSANVTTRATEGADKKVAIIGAGPGGMATAIELAKAGAKVELFEQHGYAGGMVGGAVPEYRLPQAIFNKDFKIVEDLGVEVHFSRRLGQDLRLSTLRSDGFDAVVIMVGAQRSKTLALEGEDCADVVDALRFLRMSRENRALTIGERVGVIGAGDTAMDCARVARRQNSRQVTLIYRRSIDQMPADREELAQLMEEGVDVLEMAKPEALIVEDGRLRALGCRRTTYARDRDASGRKIPHEVADSEFEVPLDTLILAISQHAILDFLESEPVRINERGYIEVDPDTFETSVPGLYAGGDVANEGPASIVKAVAAGKAIARHILDRATPTIDAAVPGTIDPASLLRRRSRREKRIRPPQIGPENRNNFDEVTLTYSPQQARSEAARCLDCDKYCSICVGVCPNLALQTYETESLEVRLPTISCRRGEVRIETSETFRVYQPYQVAVLTDFCNECGNCNTFCPTAGRPFRDKPRLYLDRGDFAQQEDNAFMLTRDEDRWALDARRHGEDHRIELNGSLDYTMPLCHVRLDPHSFAIQHVDALRDFPACSLEPCAEMFVLLKGLQQSLPFLPPALPDSASTGRIRHPGYEE